MAVEDRVAASELGLLFVVQLLAGVGVVEGVGGMAHERPVCRLVGLVLGDALFQRCMQAAALIEVLGALDKVAIPRRMETIVAAAKRGGRVRVPLAAQLELCFTMGFDEFIANGAPRRHRPGDGVVPGSEVDEVEQVAVKRPRFGPPRAARGPRELDAHREVPCAKDSVLHAPVAVALDAAREVALADGFSMGRELGGELAPGFGLGLDKGEPRCQRLRFGGVRAFRPG